MTQQTDRLNTALAGRYRIERHLGEGGMASVYLCEDLRHKRKVALKLLKPELAAVLGADRFVQEITTTASLQHPHILPLFDSGTADGFLFYVMPFIEGETLRDKLNRETQLGVDEAVRVAREVLDALEYAHQHGIVHRDVKPENILLHGGHAMVADFGIALAVSAAAGGRMTETGLSLGTPHYMSPEQATAEKEITARSDVYSLGPVLYEMLCGQPPHVGGSAQQIIMRIITDSARPVSEIRKAVPQNVVAAVAKSLEKLPADRFESAKAFSEALANPAYTNATFSGTAAGSAAGARSLKRPLIAVSVLAAVLLGTSLWGWLRPAPTPAVRAQFELQPPDSIVPVMVGSVAPIALSRDGSVMVFQGIAGPGEPPGLYVRRLGERTVQRIKGTDNASTPHLSPDGSEVLFSLVSPNQTLKRVSVSGGVATTVTDSGNPGASWGDAHQIVYTRTGQLWKIAEDGGPQALLATPDSARGHTGYTLPEILPGGRAALIAINKTGGGDRWLGVVTIPGGKVTELGIRGTYPRYSAIGHVLFATSDGVLFAAPFSTRSLKVTGASRRIVEGVAVGSGGAAAFAVAQNGTLAYLEGASGSNRRLVSLDRHGVERPIPGEPQQYGDPRVSPDGRKVAVTIGSSGSGGNFGGGLWLVDVVTGARERLTADGEGYRADWTRDGTRVVFFRDSAGKHMIVSRSVNRSTADQVLLSNNAQGMTEIAAGPAHGFAALRSGTANNRDIFIAPMDSLGALRPLVATKANEVDPAVSADGRLLAYASDETGKPEIYVQPIPGPGARVQVSVNGGIEPVWSPNGSTLYYRGGARVLSAEIGAAPLKVQRRDSLFADRYQRGSNHQGWSIFPNGRDFLVVSSEVTNRSNKLIVILNWSQGRGSKAGTNVEP